MPHGGQTEKFSEDDCQQAEPHQVYGRAGGRENDERERNGKRDDRPVPEQPSADAGEHQRVDCSWGLGAGGLGMELKFPASSLQPPDPGYNSDY
jgi:hypothetical protein